jgi:hypothetical protein
MADRQHLQNLERELLAKGMLIEAGFVGLRLAAIPLDAPAIQIEEMRNAFFAGAQHLMSSIMTVLDPGADVTDADVDRMAAIHAELDGFIEQFKLRHFPAEGRA